MTPLNEKIADRITGGGLTEARARLDTLGRQHEDLRNETRKLTRQIEVLKDGGMLAEDYADRSWNDRLALDRQWTTISGYAQHRVILKTDVDMYHDLMSYAYQYCPLIRAAVDIKTQYTFGQAYAITADEDNPNKPLINAIVEDPRNRHALFGAQAIAEADKELQKGGNVYFAIWDDDGYNPVQVRIWTSYEIVDVILDPQDGDTPLYYVRTWTTIGGQRTVAYPSIYNDDPATNLPQDKIGMEVDATIHVFQMSEGRQAKQKWALTPYTPALIWNRAFEQFLLDFAAIVQIIRKYATMFTTKGGEAQVASLQAQFSQDQQDPPAIGNGLVATEGNDFKVVDAGSNKIVGPADSRYFLLQFCASVRIPENMLCGNAQTGNRASAQELTANFLPTIEERQTMWSEVFREIFTFILQNNDFEVSFPPIRTQDAQTYVATLLTAAKYMQPRDVIKAVYEACDIKTPKEKEINALIDKIETQIAASPDDMAALNNLTQSTQALNRAVQEALRTGKAAAT